MAFFHRHRSLATSKSSVEWLIFPIPSEERTNLPESGLRLRFERGDLPKSLKVMSTKKSTAAHEDI